MKDNKRLRHVVIGVAARIFRNHRLGLALDSAVLVAASDVNVELGQQRAAELGCPFYRDHRQMLTEVEADVAVILTPPPSHAPIAIDCLEAGLHVLVEKPMAVQVSEAAAMIEAAAKSGRLLAVNFQHRFRPEIRAARRLIQDGQLGEIQRVEVVAISPRTPVYYGSGDGWHLTWAGSGGGLLMIQAPHELDLIYHLVGRPVRVAGWIRTYLHSIQPEDTAHAILEWPNGAVGYFHGSTAQIGQPQRIDLVGTRGILNIRAGELAFQQIEGDIREVLLASEGRSAKPELRVIMVDLERGAGDHVAVYRNLHSAILDGAELVVSGQESFASLELANAIVYSSHMHREVDLPMDGQAYSELLATLTSGNCG